MKLNSLRTRFTLAVSAVVVLAALGTVVNGWLVNRFGKDELRAEVLQQGYALWRQVLAAEEDAMESGKTTLTRNRDAIKALRAGDVPALREAALPTYRRLSAGGLIDALAVVDAGGRVLMHAPEEGTGAVPALVSRALSEQKVARGLVRLSSGEARLVVALPLYVRGRLVGAGVLYKSPAMALRKFAEAVGGMAALYAGDGRLLVAGSDSGRPDEVLSMPFKDADVTVQRVENSYYRIAVQPIPGNREQPLAWLVSARDVSDVVAREHQAEYLTYGVVVLAGLLMLGLLNWQMRSACDALSRVAAKMEGVAGGDLSVEVEVTRDDELGALQRAAREMVERLRGLLQRVGESADGLAGASAQLRTISTHTREGMDGQLTQTRQLAAAMAQMVESIREVARNAENTAAAARGADTQAREGIEIVEGAVARISPLAQEVETASGLIGDLEKDADSIGSVLDVIGGIAEQTNLLALNAAIEAARAGEQGRGFAVVAEEVRTLAGRTQDATREIQQMIEGLQQRVGTVVKAMADGRDAAREGVEQAGRSGECLTGINARVNEITAMITEIASAAEEQSRVSQEVGATVDGISKVAERTAADAREMDASNAALAEMAEGLRQVVGQFRA